MELAPIALFAYNRPWHTQKTLEALASNQLADQSELFVFFDAPKQNISPHDLEQHRKVKKLISNISGFKKVVVEERTVNFGLAKNIVEGITDIIDKYGRLIVLEDDLVTSNQFLKYCNQALEVYKDCFNVFSINAYQFPLSIAEFNTFLSPKGTSSWGWATWSDRWALYLNDNHDPEKILKNPLQRDRFDYGNVKYSLMLNNNKSWAIKWYYSVYIRNALGLYPTISLVENIGLDGTGENSGTTNLNQDLFVDDLPKIIKQDVININYVNKLYDYYLRLGSRSNNQSKLAGIKKLKHHVLKWFT